MLPLSAIASFPPHLLPFSFLFVVDARHTSHITHNHHKRRHHHHQVSSMWEDYCSQMMLIRSIFLYLDRTYVMTLPGLRSLVDTGLVSLRQHLAAHPKVQFV